MVVRPDNDPGFTSPDGRGGTEVRGRPLGSSDSIRAKSAGPLDAGRYTPCNLSCTPAFSS